jgi:hypothetical protein
LKCATGLAGAVGRQHSYGFEIYDVKWCEVPDGSGAVVLLAVISVPGKKKNAPQEGTFSLVGSTAVRTADGTMS